MEAAKEQGLKLLDGMPGHPGMVEYWDRGYDLIWGVPYKLAQRVKFKI